MPDTPLYCTQYQKDLIKHEKSEHQRKELAHIAAIVYAGMEERHRQNDGIDRAISIASCIMEASKHFGKVL